MKKDETYCRTCYGHLAGKLGVQVTKNLMKRKYITVDDKSFKVTEKGKLFFESLGIDIEVLKKKKRLFTRACIDGSEKQLHLGGSLGVAFTDWMIHLGWLKHKPDSRALEVTEKGAKELTQQFDVKL